MGISCYCDDDYEWYYRVGDKAFTSLEDFRCYGCCQDKQTGELVRDVQEYQVDEDGEETDDKFIGYLCESCSDLYDSFTELGFCLSADWGFIRDARREYINEFLPSNHKFDKSKQTQV